MSSEIKVDTISEKTSAAGVTIDGKTYDIYTFTTPTTRASIRLTDEARARITDEDLLMAVATTELPDDFS